MAYFYKDNTAFEWLDTTALAWNSYGAVIISALGTLRISSFSNITLAPVIGGSSNLKRQSFSIIASPLIGWPSYDSVHGPLRISSEAIFSSSNVGEPNYDIALYYTWYDSDIDGLALSSFGDFNPRIEPSLSKVTVSSEATMLVGNALVDITSLGDSGLRISSFADFYFGKKNRSHWVKWSDIGNLDFTIDRKNVAGEMPLDWEGVVSNIHKLVVFSDSKMNSKVIAYGANGVSAMLPVGNSYGLNTIHRIGLKGRDSFACNDFLHFFIDNLGCLYSLSDQLELLDYREYLSKMTNPVLTLDEVNQVLHICDGTLGYIYSINSKSFGAGPVNITGIGSIDDDLYISSPAVIETPVASLVTDIYDFGTRKLKTIYNLEIGTNLTRTLQIAIDYRRSQAANFISTAWVDVNSTGKTRIIIEGVEFRFKIKGAIYEKFELDYFTINGKIQVH